MSNWKYHLRVSEDRGAFKRGEITIQELGHRFASKIRKLSCYGKEESMFSSTDELYDCAFEFDHVGLPTNEFQHFPRACAGRAETRI